MLSILVSGATGNIGLETTRALLARKSDAQIIVAAVRNIERARKKFANEAMPDFRVFDFDQKDTFPAAFHKIDILFLLRPPQIADVPKYFKPLLEGAQEAGIKKIVFLSVQGVEKSKGIPHHKIENLIREMEFDYIFLRPSYFMQNLTTTLLNEIHNNHSITLPAGKANFLWVDVKNIGEAAAELILNFDAYKNQAMEITGSELKNFGEVGAMISEISGRKVTYHSINPVSFYFKKRKSGLAKDFALVMTLLHFLPRVQSDPEISDNYEKLTGKKPTLLRQFLKREKAEFGFS